LTIKEIYEGGIVMLITETDGLKSFILPLKDENGERSGPSESNKNPLFKMLSKRQKEVLVWLAKGMTVYEISRQLGVSEDTIKFHKKNIFNKLDANCTVQAVIKAIKQDYIKLSDI